MSQRTLDEQLSAHLNFLAQDQENLTLLIKISTIYLELGNYDQAQIYLDKAQVIDPIACLNYQGLLDLQRGQFAGARKKFTESLAHEQTPTLRYNLAFACFLDGELSQAHTHLSCIDPELLPSEGKLLEVRIFHGLGELDKALSCLYSFLQEEPHNAEALGVAALLHFDNDELAYALEKAEQALKLDPDNYDARLVLCMNGLNSQSTSIETVKELLAINSTDCRLWFALGSLQMSQGDFVSAEDALAQAIAIYPDFYDATIMYGWCLLVQNKLDTAARVFEEAATRIKELADAWGGWGTVYALQGNMSAARPLLDQAFTIDCNCFIAQIGHILYTAHQEPERANQELVHFLKNSDNSVSQKLAVLMDEVQQLAIA
ncbi:MAG: hypothetical protein BGO90_02680 [Legionella sp. 40-6]|nr:tetratricopeptide repeat protein [Legionella sp.]OJY01916.1 MAG: hypothetical protein BGO90_02680 [Legionella sp. 40-6]